jgi:peptide chain release factor 3
LNAADPAKLKSFADQHLSGMAEDRDGTPVLLARSRWELDQAVRKWPEISFLKTREFG